MTVARRILLFGVNVKPRYFLISALFYKLVL